MNKINFKGSVMLNPTPVVLVTSINKEGKTNVFTIGWVSTVCTKPPVIAVGIRPERLSYEYIKESEEWYSKCIGERFTIHSESKKGGRGKYVVRIPKHLRWLMNGHMYGWVDKEHCILLKAYGRECNQIIIDEFTESTI